MHSKLDTYRGFLQSSLYWCQKEAALPIGDWGVAGADLVQAWEEEEPALDPCWLLSSCWLLPGLLTYPIYGSYPAISPQF